MSDAKTTGQHASSGPDSLEAVLADLCHSSALEGRWLGKSEVLNLLSTAFAGDGLAAFERIRTTAKGTGVLGSVCVRCQGERRGTKYTFGVVAHDAVPLRSAPPTAAHNHPVGSAGLRDFPIPHCPALAGAVDVYQGDNLEIIGQFPANSFDLIYIDPPFNTGHSQARTRIKTERDEEGDRVGFQGKRYRTTVIGTSSYADKFDDYMAFLIPRLEQAFRLLKSSGSLFLHLDYREVHYAKVALDQIFGRDSFINEIIWAYDYGGRAKNRWSPKHDNILWYAKNANEYCFNYDEMDRIPYMAPSLVGEEKAARGKTPTDTWWHTIVSPNGKEKTGYPTQKPLGILTRIVRIHSRPGDRLLDFFAGSGSFGEAGASLGRHVTLIDESTEAISVMRRRFASYTSTFVVPHASEPQSAPPSGEQASREPEDSRYQQENTSDVAIRSAAKTALPQPTQKSAKRMDTTQRSLF